MASPIAAGVRYFLPVFVAAFALGVLRTLLVAPRIGELPAVAIELPLVLAVAWAVCRHVAPGVSPRLGARVVMGGTALLLLLGIELAMSVWLFGRPAGAWVASLATPAGALGLAGQVGFGLLPLFVRR